MAMPSDDILSASPIAGDQRVRYGPEPEQFAELYFGRENSRASLVLNIHGGFWRAKYDFTHASHLCSALAARGWNVANLEYRRVGSRGGGWPRTFEDIRNAHRYLVQHARELGLATKPAIAMGHSAGGQLALCLAAHEQSIAGCVSLAGVLDLRRAWELHLSDDAVVEFLGGTPEQVPDHYREASPSEISISARQAIIHGTGDDIVPIGISASYAAAKIKRGEQVKFIEVSNADHFDLIDPRSKAFGTVISAIEKLLQAPEISG